jgi:hypothetical protein
MGETSFDTRRFSIGGDLGLRTGLGARIGYAVIPELTLEAHAGTAILWQNYGIDAVYRPLAGRFNLSPTLDVGFAVLQNNLGSGITPMPSSHLGVEWQSAGGVRLGARAGAGLLITPGDVSRQTAFDLTFDAMLHVGYAF